MNTEKISSIPSTAIARSIGPIGRPTACSASTRWIVVSCAIRRGQNPAR